MPSYARTFMRRYLDVVDTLLMKPAPFEYVSPSSPSEAATLLDERENAIVVAGNQTLGMDMSYRELTPDYLIDITELGLDYITADDDTIQIGATTLHRDIAASALLDERLQALAEAGEKVAGPSVRNVGTFGGSLGKAHSAANYPTVLVGMDTTLTVRSTDGIREVDFRDYLAGGLAADEFIEQASIKLCECAGNRSASAFVQLKRAKLTWPTVNAAAGVTVVDGIVTNGWVGLANVAPHHIRVPKAAEVVVDTELNEDALDTAFDAAVDAADPASELHADDEFKIEMAGEYATRALETAYERALE